MKIFKKAALALMLVLAVCLPAALLTACGGEEEISLESSFKTEYFVGESLNTSGGKIKLIDSAGSTSYIDIESSMISGFSTQEVGQYTMVVTYRNKNIDVDYTVKPWDVIGGAFYTDVTQQPALFISFDKAQGKVAMFSAENPYLVLEEDKPTYQTTKTFDEKGNIVYTFTAQAEPQGENVEYKVSNIRSDSLTLSAKGKSKTLKIYTYQEPETEF